MNTPLLIALRFSGGGPQKRRLPSFVHSVRNAASPKDLNSLPNVMFVSEPMPLNQLPTSVAMPLFPRSRLGTWVLLKALYERAVSFLLRQMTSFVSLVQPLNACPDRFVNVAGKSGWTVVSDVQPRNAAPTRRSSSPSA